MKSISILLLLLVNTTALAQSMPSPVLTKFLSTFDGERENYDSDELIKYDQVKETIQNDLIFLGNLKFKNSSQLFKKFFGSKKSSSVMNYLNNSIDEFAFDDWLQGPKAPIASASGPGSQKAISFGYNYLRENFTPIERASIIIHEARHNQSKRFDHVNCPSEFIFLSSSGLSLANLAACEEIHDGSYGTQAVFLMNVARFCLNCDEETLETAQKLATDYINRIIDKEQKAILMND